MLPYTVVVIDTYSTKYVHEHTVLILSSVRAEFATGLLVARLLLLQINSESKALVANIPAASVLPCRCAAADAAAHAAGVPREAGRAWLDASKGGHLPTLQQLLKKHPHLLYYRVGVDR